MTDRSPAKKSCKCARSRPTGSARSSASRARINAVVTNYRGLRIDYPQPLEKDPHVAYDAVYFAGEPADDDREGGV